MLLKPICGHQGHVPRSSRFFCCGWRCLLWPRRRGWGPRSWNSFASVDKCVCVFSLRVLCRAAPWWAWWEGRHMPLFLWQGKVAPWGICFGFLRRGRSSVVCARRLSLFQNFQLKGPVSEATDLNFKPIYNWGRGRRGLWGFSFRTERK